MKNTLRLFALLFFSALPAFAQFTIVSGTVTDGNHTPYSGAKLTITLSLPVGTSGAILNGAQIAGVVGPITLDNSGSFLVRLADNTVIQCTNAQGQIIACAPQTQWSFAITESPGVPLPLGTGPQTCSATLTISGSSQNVGGSFAACPSLSNISASIVATPTVNAIYASIACPSPTPANCFPILDDVLVTTDAITTASSTTVGTQSTDPAFVCAGGAFPCSSGGDVGKIDFSVFNCPGTVSNCTNNCPQSTITQVTDAHHAVVGIACPSSSSAAAHSNNFFWGHDDATALINAFAVILSGTNGSQRQTLFISCGMMFIGQQVFEVPAAVRNINGGVNGCPGGGSTTIVPLPKMNCNNTGDAPGCLIGQASLALENTGANLPGWIFSNITFWGGGTSAKDAAATYSNPAVGIVTQIFDKLDSVYVIGWVWLQANTVGMKNLGSYWLNSGSVAGGIINCQLGGAVAVNGVMSGGTCGGEVGGGGPDCIQIISGGNVYTNGVYVNQCGDGVNNLGGQWFSSGDHITTSMKSSNASAQSYLTGTWLDQFGGGNSALTISAGQVYLTQVKITAGGGSPAVNQTGGTIFDDCGNVLTGAATSVWTTGGVVGNCSLVQSITNPTVASRLTSLGSTQLLPTVRWPGPNITVVLYAYDSAAGSGCTGNTTVTWTISYTDPTGTAQTSTATETITTNGGATGSDALKTTLPISVNPNTVVNYSTTYAIGTGCTTGPSYAANIRLQ